MSTRTALGLDGAVAYTLFARLVNIVGSTGTVLLIVRFLSPVEQGFYYTMLSLVSLQTVFEMGFSFVIQQLAAHECIHLKFHEDGGVSGIAAAHRRLASTLQLSLRWYTVAALAMTLILAPLGMIFFGRHTGMAGERVHWQGPWLAVVVASAIGLWSVPFYAFLEGCGQVRAVAAMRFRQAAATAGFAWVPMLLHHGLYAPAMALVGYVGAGMFFLFTRWPLLGGLLAHAAHADAICWSRKIWPFQWRIAVSWMCSYFTVQAFVPLLFAARGPVEAGKMGMSLSITGYMTVLALAWTSTKTTPFARMIAQSDFRHLDGLFLRTLGQSVAAFTLMSVVACGTAALLPWLAPRIGMRIVSIRLFAVLLLAAGANFLVQSVAILLRCFKREPFLAQSLTVAALTLALAAATISRWGNTAAALSYFTSTAVVGLPIAAGIFLESRRVYLKLDPATALRDQIGMSESACLMNSGGGRDASIGM